LSSSFPREGADRSAFDDLSERFFAAAAVGDSALVMTMSTDAEVWIRISAIRRSEPELLQTAARGLRPFGPVAMGADSIVLFYQMPYQDTIEEIGIEFQRTDDSWRIRRLGFPSRM
jgi:hypothetical protein